MKPREGAASRFPFRVEWGGATMEFAEVQGLGSGELVCETARPPARSGMLTLARGVARFPHGYRAWLESVSASRERRLPVTVSLVDEQGRTRQAWAYVRAWPSKLIGPALLGGDNEIAIETLEIAHEGLALDDDDDH